MRSANLRTADRSFRRLGGCSIARGGREGGRGGVCSRGRYKGGGEGGEIGGGGELS